MKISEQLLNKSGIIKINENTTMKISEQLLNKSGIIKINEVAHPDFDIRDLPLHCQRFAHNMQRNHNIVYADIDRHTGNPFVVFEEFDTTLSAMDLVTISRYNVHEINCSDDTITVVFDADNLI